MNKRITFLIGCVAFLFIISSPLRVFSESHTPGETWQANNVSVEEITFHFNKDYTVGMYANGDYWVLGPVTITAITPDFTGEHHGWEVNPTPGTNHAFDVRVSEAFDTELIPALPYTANGIESIVKTVSRPPYDETLRPSLLFAAVLTVVNQAPPGNGAEVFRPPYIGTNKPYYRVEDIKRELIPTHKAEVLNTTTLQSVVDWFKNVQLDHILYGSGASRSRPLNNLPDYGSAIAQRTASGALRLMVEGNEEAYMEAMIAYLQCGIDYYHIVENVGIWNRGSGEAPGHKLPIVFFVTLLGDEVMKNNIRNLKFYEDYMVYYGTDGFALWGDWGWGSEGTSQVSENAYWNNIATGGGSRTHRDPYGYIDGGQIPGEYYQYCCTSLPFKGVALALQLMPKLREVWDPLPLFDYVDRWVAHGTWTQPDPCAAVGEPDDYGITWGPDPNKPGDCIKDGIGRFPQLHGTNTNGGNYGSGFHNSMWVAYRATADDAEAVPPFVAITYPRAGSVLSGIVNIEASAFGLHSIESVQFQENSFSMATVTETATDTTDSYLYQWDTRRSGNGLAILSAFVTDTIGNTYVSKAIMVTVDNPTSTENPIEINSSAALVLQPAYPNPFSTSTTITIQANQNGHYSLRVYNIMGNLVTSLMDGILPEGLHTIRWDGTDTIGQNLNSGVYYYQLITDGKVVGTNRVILHR